MSDDLLERAARAARHSADATEVGPAQGRAQVIEAVLARRRAEARRLAVSVPLAVLLVTSTAIAAATGTLPKVWRVLQDVGAQPLPSAPPLKAPAPVRAHRAVPQRELPLPDLPAPMPQVQPEPAPAEEPPTAADTAPESVEQAATPSLAPIVQAQPALRAQHHVQAPPRLRPLAAKDPLELFRQARRIHASEHDWPRALAAWQAYLDAAPDGELVPDAQWHVAICLARVGRAAAARVALEPFARGEHGEYRQAQARDLMEALDATPH